MAYNKAAQKEGHVSSQNDGFSVTLDYSQGKTINLILTEPTYIASLENLEEGTLYTLKVQQDSIGGHGIAFPSDIAWKDGVTPTFSSGPDQKDILIFNKINGIIYCIVYTDFNPDLFTFNNALKFNSADSNYVNVAHDASLNFSGGDFSISMWVKLTTTGVDQILAHKMTVGFTGFFLYLTAAGQVLLEVDDTPSITRISTLNSYAPGSWYHIVAIKSTNTVNLWNFYINGVLESKAILGPTFIGSVDNTEPLILGSTGTSNYFDGVMDEVSFYNKALTPQEVGYLYNSGIGNPPIGPLLTNLTAYYKFDEALSISPGTNIAVDSSTNGNNGTLTNFGTRTETGDPDPAWIAH